jgi:coiled-coil domain-containing protein 6
MLLRVEQEEEFLTNSLQKRLDLVLREKVNLSLNSTL